MSEVKQEQQVTWVSYVLLFLAIIIFSGFFANPIPGLERFGLKPTTLQVLDFTALNGRFGVIAEGRNFMGSGGDGARQGVMFALGLIPALMLALGIVRIVDGNGGLLAAERLINPIFRPVLGIPGICGLGFITSLQSTDGAAAMTKGLFDSGMITDDERTLFVQLQFSADGTVTNYFSSIAAIFGPIAMIMPISIPLVVIFICKILGTNVLRAVVAMNRKKEA